jgi:mycoredoxin
MSAPLVVLYGNRRCGAVRRARSFLEQNGIRFRYVDIDQDEPAARRLEGLAGGYRSVPTLEWPDGSTLVEPSEGELVEKCGTKP